jgi:hypothetical protein
VAQCKHLSNNEEKQLLAVLNQFQSLFDGSLGHWKSECYDITFQTNVKPYHARPYPIPKVHESTSKWKENAYARLVFSERLIDQRGDHQHLSFQRRMEPSGSYPTSEN